MGHKLVSVKTKTGGELTINLQTGESSWPNEWPITQCSQVTAEAPLMGSITRLFLDSVCRKCLAGIQWETTGKKPMPLLLLLLLVLPASRFAFLCALLYRRRCLCFFHLLSRRFMMWTSCSASHSSPKLFHRIAFMSLSVLFLFSGRNGGCLKNTCPETVIYG